MNMTDLAGLIQTIGDKIFTVQFHKQPKEETAINALQAATQEDFTD